MSSVQQVWFACALSAFYIHTCITYTNYEECKLLTRCSIYSDCVSYEEFSLLSRCFPLQLYFIARYTSSSISYNSLCIIVIV